MSLSLQVKALEDRVALLDHLIDFAKADADSLTEEGRILVQTMRKAGLSNYQIASLFKTKSGTLLKWERA